MRGIPSLITDIRKKVFTEVARMAYSGNGYEAADELPYKIVPGDRPLHRESVFLERAIAGERVRVRIEKAQKTVDLAKDTADKYNIRIPMSNKVYDVLKVVVAIILPLLSTLYIGLANIWGFGFGEQVDKTIQLIIAAINALLGMAIVKSSSDYHKGS